jgi:hypothetical protein
LGGGSPELNFKAGRYRVSDFEFIPILTVQINFESVHVAVRGISRVAESVAQELVETVSASAGASRSWAGIEPEVQLVGYATRTRVNLSPNAFEALLSPGFRVFLDEQITGGARYGAHAGAYNARHGLQPPPRAQLTAALDDVVLLLTLFDPDTGNSNQARLGFSVMTRSDYGSGIVSVSSQLPYELHIEMIGALIAALR